MYLESPDGKILKLVENKGGDGGINWEGFVGTIWTDAAATTMPVAVNSTTRDFRPDGSLSVGSAGITPNITSFAGFAGSPVSGTWKLHVYDDAAGDVGAVQWWELSFGGFINATDFNIPDNNPTGGVTSTINVSGLPNPLPNAANLVVHTVVEHTWDADLDMYLIAPNGAILRLSTDNGGSDDDYATRFADFAGVAVQAFTAPFAGYLRPEGGTNTENGLTPTITTIGALNGINPNGNWQLRAFDDLSGDLGIIRFWALDFPDLTSTTTSTVNDRYTDWMDIATVPNLSPVIVSTDDTLCPNITGTYVTTSNQGVAIQWTIFNNSSPGTILATGTNDTITYAFPSPGDYTVKLKITSQCCNNSDSTTYAVHVLNLAPPTVSVNPTPICPGQSSTLTVTAPSGSAITWNTGALTQSITVSPSVTTSYTVDVITPDGCVLPQASGTVVVHPEPTAQISGNTIICAGDPLTLTATGTPASVTFNWTNPLGFTATGASITHATPADTFYYVTPVANGCTGQPDSVRIFIIPRPVPQIISDTSAICFGQSVWLVASGGKTFTWNPGNIVADSIFVSPTTTTTYSLSSSIDGCNSLTDGTFILTVNPLPNISVIGNNVICNGQSTNLTASGAVSYTWSPATGLSSTTGANVVASPTANITYTISGTDGNNCSNTTTFAITVTAPPIVSASASSPTICPGESTTLTASGAVSYTWSPATGLSSTTGSVVTATPSATTTYTVVGTDASNCQNTATVIVTVAPIPTVSVTTPDNTLCVGESTTLNASGATSYTWSPATGLSATTGASVTANPTVSTTYTVTGTGSNGCTNTATIAITVNPLPTISISGNTSLCTGQTTTLTASGASSYSWNPTTGLTPTTGPVVTAGPTATTTYTVTGTDANGCVNTATVIVNVGPLPVVTVSADDNSICAGQQTATLTAAGAVTFDWSPATGLSSTTGAVVTANPPSTTT
ncbi:MAG: hypothetical protein NZ108_02655, partial [Bacteroidia bacterium]|nr:hypothetical protein [Bacteroidia bacterium]